MSWRWQSQAGEVDWRSPEENHSLLLAEAQSTEMLGWAAVAERAMLELALRAVADGREPQERAALEGEWAAGFSALASAFVSSAMAAASAAAEQAERERQAVRVDVAALQRERAELEAELRLMEGRLSVTRAEAAEEAAVLAREGRALQERLTRLRTERAAVAQELAAVWDYVHAATHDDGDVGGGEGEEEEAALAVSARRVCARMLECEEDNAALRDRVAALEDALTAAEEQLQHPLPPPLAPPAAATAAPSNHAAQVAPHREEPMLTVAAPRPTYDRLLPSPTVNPVTASLLRVKEQVRRLREASQEPVRLGAANDSTVRSPQSASTAQGRSGNEASLFSRTVYMQTVTPVRRPAPRDSIARNANDDDDDTDGHGHGDADANAGVGEQRGLGGDGSIATSQPSPRGCLPVGAPTPPSAWRDRMSELQQELRGLRRDLGGVR